MKIVGIEGMSVQQVQDAVARGGVNVTREVVAQMAPAQPVRAASAIRPAPL